MIRYTASENMLVDYFTQKHQGNFDLHVPKDQCAFLELSDGRSGFLTSGNHRVVIDRPASPLHHSQTVNMFWFNLSDHIDLHLTDTISVMEQLLKSVDPELKLFASVNVRVDTRLTVRIADPEKLLHILSRLQSSDRKPVLEKETLAQYLEKKLHFPLENAVNGFKQDSGINLFQLSAMTDSIEVKMISDICDLLDSLSLELISAHIYQIAPTRDSVSNFQEKEAETLSWYNQVQMDRYSHASKNRRTKKTRAIPTLPEQVQLAFGNPQCNLKPQYC